MPAVAFNFEDCSINGLDFACQSSLKPLGCPLCREAEQGLLKYGELGSEKKREEKTSSYKKRPPPLPKTVNMVF